MTERLAVSNVPKKQAPPVGVLFEEVKAFNEAHRLATVTKQPQTVMVDGQKITVVDEGATRLVIF